MNDPNRSVAPGPYNAGYGITLREYFAGQIMAALVGGDKPCGGDVAGVAVHYADALLAELSK